MLDNALTTQLKTYLEMVREPIVLVPSPYRGDDAAKSSKSAHMDELLSEIAALSDKVSVGKPVDNERTPSFAITRPGSPIDIRFAGLPMGHEFTSLVLALLQVGGHPVKEEQSLIDAVRAVKGEHHFVTYMSLTCQNCPTVVQALNAMAVLNPNIHHTAVDGGTHTDEVEAKGIASVPAIYLDGEDWGSGRMDMAEILERLDADAAQGAKEDLSQRDPYDVLVVGAGPAGVPDRLIAPPSSSTLTASFSSTSSPLRALGVMPPSWSARLGRPIHLHPPRRGVPRQVGRRR